MGGSYPSAEIDKQAKGLFNGVNTEYHGTKGDFVYSGIGGWFIGNNPNARQVGGLSFGQAHSEANQNINNLKYVYKLEENGNKEKKWTDVYEMLKNTYPNGVRKFNKLSEEE